MKKLLFIGMLIPMLLPIISIKPMDEETRQLVPTGMTTSIGSDIVDPAVQSFVTTYGKPALEATKDISSTLYSGIQTKEGLTCLAAGSAGTLLIYATYKVRKPIWNTIGWTFKTATGTLEWLFGTRQGTATLGVAGGAAAVLAAQKVYSNLATAQ